MTLQLNIYTPNLSEVRGILNEHGVAVLTNYFENGYADEIFLSVKKWLINLNTNLTDKTSTWKYRNMPLGPRYGMYQSIISNCPKFWELREKFYPIFSEILSE